MVHKPHIQVRARQADAINVIQSPLMIFQQQYTPLTGICQLKREAIIKERIKIVMKINI